MRRLLLTLILVVGCAPLARAQESAARLITPAQLAATLDDPGLVLLHVGDRAEYNAEHIPGARFMGLHDIADMRDNLALEMPPIDELRPRLEAAGISDGSKVVVYFGKDWVSPSTRVLFTLAHAGLGDVALLDGGMGAWKSAGHPVTDVVPPSRSGTLTLLTARDDIADAAYLQAHIGKPGFVLIDARDAAFYAGTREGGPRDRRVTGHIAGAVSVPYTSVAAADLTLKPRAELEAIFARAGVKPGDTVVTYCHIGQQATAVLFAARTLGYKVLLYDGSVEDWARRGLPVGKAQAPDSRLEGGSPVVSPDPSWSPQGEILFTSLVPGAGGSIAVLMLPASSAAATDPARAKALTTSLGRPQMAVWSPDGTRIALQATRDGNTDIYVLRADGTGESRLTTHAALDEMPSWFPDGSKLAFQSDRDGYTRVYIMKADGRNVTALFREDNRLIA